MKIRKFNSIDLFKLIMAYSVVAIHTHPLEGCQIDIVNRLYDRFIIMAVPFFFLATGFLLAFKMEYPYTGIKNEEILRKHLVKIIKMYLIWTVIYLPLAVINYVHAGTKPALAVWLYIRDFLFVGEHYNSWPLWYLLATVYALSFLLFLLKHKQPFRRIIVFGIIIFIISIGISYLVKYNGELSPALLNVQRFLQITFGKGRIFTGMFYIPMGMLLSRKKPNTFIAGLMLLFGYIANVATDNWAIGAFYLPVAAIGFFCVINAIKLPDSPFFPTVRKMSIVIYFIHMYVWSIYYQFVYGTKTFGFKGFLTTCIISSIIAFIYVYLNRMIKKRK